MFRLRPKPHAIKFASRLIVLVLSPGPFIFEAAPPTALPIDSLSLLKTFKRSKGSDMLVVD